MRHHLNDVRSLVAGQARAGEGAPALHEKRAWASRPSAERAAIALRTGLADHLGVMTDTASMELYRRLVDLARAHDVEVYGIAYPVTAQYLEGCPLPERRRIDEFLASLPFTRILDYSALIEDPTYFRNEDHINEKGAELLAEQIRRDTGVRF